MNNELRQVMRQALEALEMLDDAFCSDDYGTREGRTKGRKALMSARASVSALAATLSHSEPEAVQVPQGWRMVPEVPTDDMLRAIRRQRSGKRVGAGDRADWAAWLAAAPKPPAQAQAEARGDIPPKVPTGDMVSVLYLHDPSDATSVDDGGSVIEAEARGDEPVAFAVFWRKRGGDVHMNSVHIERDSARQVIENINNCSDFHAYYVPLYTRPAPAAPQAGAADLLWLVNWMLQHIRKDDDGVGVVIHDTCGEELREWLDKAYKAVDEVSSSTTASQPMSREGMSEEQRRMIAQRAADKTSDREAAAIYAISETERAHGIGSGSDEGVA